MRVVIVLALVLAGAMSVSAQCAGACQDTSVYCPSSYTPGLCPGPDNIQCCSEPTPDCNGQCQDNSLDCSGSYVAGDCPGPDNVQCCTSSGPGPSPGSGCQGFADSQWNCADPSCSSTVNAGDPQPNYECAEFGARTVAAAGLIPGLDSMAPQSTYGSFGYNGNTYDLLWTSSQCSGCGSILGLEDYLIAAGWQQGGAIQECSVLLVVGADGYKTHVVVGVADDTIDAHNNARYHVDQNFYDINAVYNPPSALFNNTRPTPKVYGRPPHKPQHAKPSN